MSDDIDEISPADGLNMTGNVSVLISAKRTGALAKKIVRAVGDRDGRAKVDKAGLRHAGDLAIEAYYAARDCCVVRE